MKNNYNEQDLIDYENSIAEYYAEAEREREEKFREIRNISNGKAMKFIMDIYGDDSVWGEETIDEKPVKVLEVMNYISHIYIEARVIRNDGKQMIFIGEVERNKGQDYPQWFGSFYYREPKEGVSF